MDRRVTQAEIEAMKAAFLARGNAITTEPAGIAYGVDAEADKAKRAEARERREYDETAHERRAEAIREAYHTGGRHAAIDAMNS